MEQKKNSNIILELEDVWKIYSLGEVKVNALRGISLSIEKGDFVAIIGASGSGKSTLMNMVGCLDVPTQGNVSLLGHNISSLSESELATIRGKTIGFIFQQYHLIPSLSAFENVKLPLEFLEFEDGEAIQASNEILARVGLSDKVYHLPTQLSGGQQQRVSIARCLVTNPDIILADEPTGALDSKTGKEVMEILHDLWEKDNKTIIIVTHDLHLAEYARTIIELKDGQIINISKNKQVKKYGK